MSFIWPWMLVTLLLTPALVGLYLHLRLQQQQAKADMGPLGIVQNAAGQPLQRQRHIPPIFSLIGLTLLFISLARPEMMVDLPRIEGTVIMAFDVSNSMLADDLEPNRMEAAKSAARIFIENQPSTIQVGVVAFSNGGLVVQPPTDDKAALLDTIDRLTPQGSTSLGQGIFNALNAIVGEPIPLDPEALAEGEPLPDIGSYTSAVILLLSDGENLEQPEPVEVAQLAAQAGVRIYPVGIGSEDGTVIDVDGYSVVTQLNEDTLQELASVTNGTYYQADDEERLRDIYNTIDLQLAIRGEMMEITALLAGLSLLFLLIGGSLSLYWFGRMP